MTLMEVLNVINARTAEINTGLAKLDDATALDIPELFPAWDVGMTYEPQVRVRYGDKLYRCVQLHTSQIDWTPNITPNLWTEVSIEEWPEWKQPNGSQDAYMIGAKVSHNNKHWICISDYCIHEPGVFGWQESEDS